MTGMWQSKSEPVRRDNAAQYAGGKNVAFGLEQLRGFIHAFEAEAAERYVELARQMDAHNIMRLR